MARELDGDAIGRAIAIEPIREPYDELVRVPTREPARRRTAGKAPGVPQDATTPGRPTSDPSRSNGRKRGGGS